MKKQKETPKDRPGPEISKAPLVKKVTLGSVKTFPPLPPQKKTSPEKGDSSKGGPSLSEPGVVELEEGVPGLLDIQAAGAIPDLLVRGVHLAYPDIEPLTEKEILWLAEPLAKILIDLDWMEKIKRVGPYVEFGVASSVIGINRIRAHEKFKREEKKKADAAQGKAGPEEKKPADAAGPAK